MKRNLPQKRKQLLKQLSEITTLRQGSISEQYYSRTDEAGEVHKQGPYYVLQTWRDGKKKSQRIGKEEVKRIQPQIDNYHRFKRIVDELIEVTEDMALQQARRR